MNGAPLPPAHGSPVRLIAPGWYGVANVKWLTRIEVLDQRYAGRFMARDYVTSREEQRDGQTLGTFSVGEAGPAEVGAGAGGARESRYVAWRRLGRADRAVEVRIDGGPWQAARSSVATRAGTDTRLRLDVWRLDWGMPQPGEHA